jgi:ATP-binding cassette subfamily B protein
LKNLQYLNKYFWKYRGRIVAGTLFILLANVFNVYAPVLVGEGIDFLVDSLSAIQHFDAQSNTAQVKTPNSLTPWFGENGSITLHAGDYTHTIVQIGLYLALGYLLMYILKGVFLFYQRQTIIVMSRHIEYDLKNEIYRQYQHLDTAFYKKNRTGDLMNRISEDVNRVRMYLGPAVMYTINLIILIVMCIAVMWKIDKELTLYTLSPLPFMMLGIFYVSTIINRRTDRVQQQQSKLSTMVQESMSGIRVLKAFDRENFFIRRFTHESDVYKTKQLELVKADALFMPVIMVLVGMSTILTLYIGSNKVIAGEISYGVIVQFVFYVNQLTWPFASVGWVSSLVQKAEASQARINEFLQQEPEVKTGTEPLPNTLEEITFEQVHFTYPESGVKALNGVSFSIKKGETVAIIGRTGSGKSTLAQLILRSYDPTEGAIRVNQKNLRDYHLGNWRERLGLVPQEVFLFSDSIRNNILFGVDHGDQQKVEKAAKLADVHDNIIGFPNGYETLLGERGINISGGQKQRISIARALIKNPEVLILDDCLSAVDTQTEENILNGLKTNQANSTTIIIAHRISSIKHAHRILVLEHGKIVEEGSHDFLLQKGGAYAELHRLQQLEEANG